MVTSSQYRQLPFIYAMAWLAYWLLLSILFGYQDGTIGWELLTRSAEMLVLVPITFLHNRYLLPQLFRGLVARYLATMAVGLLLLVLYNTATWYLLARLWPDPKFAVEYWTLFKPYYLFLCLVDVLLALAVATIVALLKHLYARESREQLQQNELLQLRLTHLQTQIQPHFFFNTLNNLYGLSLERSALLPGAILQLSNIMDYLQTAGRVEAQPLQHEITFLRAYVDLELLRIRKKDRVTFVVEVKDADIKIPTLIFLPMVENAFKHSDKAADDFFISIHIKCEGSSMICEVKNSISNRNRKTGGFGFDNLKKRLQTVFENESMWSLQIIAEQHLHRATLIFQA